MNTNPPKVSDDFIQDWSRHYDSIVWTINTIFLAGIGGLLVYSYGRDPGSTREPAASAAPLFGLSLVFFVLFYISGFRKIRRRLHERIENEGQRQFLQNPYQGRDFSQWNLYCIYMFMISIAFTERLSVSLASPFIVFLALGAAMGGIIVALWRRGASF